jgi:hypothetical protein
MVRADPLSYLARQPSVLVGIHLFLQKYQVTLAGPLSRLQLAAAAVPGPLVYRSMESQRKEDRDLD